jgi:hypothetical protein
MAMDTALTIPDGRLAHRPVLAALQLLGISALILGLLLIL